MGFFARGRLAGQARAFRAHQTQRRELAHLVAGLERLDPLDQPRAMGWVVPFRRVVQALIEGGDLIGLAQRVAGEARRDGQGAFVTCAVGQPEADGRSYKGLRRG